MLNRIPNWAWALIVTGSVLLVFAIALIVINRDSSPKGEGRGFQRSALFESDQTPSSFFPSFDSKPSPRETSPGAQEVKYVIAAPPPTPAAEPPKAKPKPVLAPKPRPRKVPVPIPVEVLAPEVIDYAAEFRRSINKARRSSGAVEMFYIPDTDTGADFSDVSVTPKVKDFSEHGIGKDISTFTVDLARTITADRFIPAILTVAINSQLPGRVTAQVETNVFGFHGRKILIPAGSKVIGTYQPLSEVGDSRLDIVWSRIIRPDGAHILTTSTSADSVGASGVGGRVDLRLWDRYGHALLLSTINAVAGAQIPVDGQRESALAESYSREVGRVSSQLIEETIDLKPILHIDAGTRILITPINDIWLKEGTPNGASFALVKDSK